ncbi:MAG TPA: tryptophan synthase subunit alpha, partial [Terriglobia bacterium]|nr:tryptophan synthase subunit alpha [Terriglobia bacterium]
MTRIEKRFERLKAEKRQAFIPYVTAGDPSREITAELIFSMEKSGADIIELGVPFSDPIADGPVIQRATERALGQHMSLRKVLQIAKDVRRQSQIPLVLFSYYNPILRYGLEQLARDAAECGIDGVLATDLTVEESGDYRKAMASANLNTIFLAAPTSSPERLKKIAEASNGFLYAVSRTGVTGETQQLSEELLEFITNLRKFTRIPIAVGFGISHPEHVKAVWQVADAAVVGSALVREIEKNIGHGDIVERVAHF